MGYSTANKQVELAGVLQTLPDRPVPKGSSKKTIPDFWKQMIVSLTPNVSLNDICRMKSPSAPRGHSEEEQATISDQTTNPAAPLIPAELKASAETKKRPKRVLALERAKREAAVNLKALPHKARRKLKSSRAPGTASKKSLAYTGNAIRSMANGLGTIGARWNSDKFRGERLHESETWPDALQNYLTASSSRPVQRDVLVGSD